MAYMILSALGAGVLGGAAESAIENQRGGSALATGAGLWLGISAVISLFLGSYFTVRMAKSITNKLGAAHGFVVASIFFILLMVGAGNAIAGLSSGFAQLVGGIGKGAATVSTSPMVQDVVNRALPTTEMKASPAVVAQGLTVRLLQGNVESAKAYYAYQTNLSPAEVDAKVAQLQNDFTQAAKVAGEKAARATADIGWSLFVTFLVGLIGALVGGRIGAHANVDRPLAAEEYLAPQVPPVLATERGSALPYVVGWLLGVPMTLLLLMFLLRAAF
jgi:hypothetical protein